MRMALGKILIWVLCMLLVSGCGQNDESSVLDSASQGKPGGGSKLIGTYNFCDYKMYPQTLPLNLLALNPINGSEKSGKYTFRMGIMAASSLTFGAELEKQKLPEKRYMAEMYVNVGNMFLEKSVDLILESVEPTVWVVRGNTSAVRKIIVRSSYCSSVLVSGVSQYSILIDTNEFKHSLAGDTSTYAAEFVQTEQYGEAQGRVFRVQ